MAGNRTSCCGILRKHGETETGVRDMQPTYWCKPGMGCNAWKGRKPMRLKVFGIAHRGRIPLKSPVVVAATSLPAAAAVLRVSVYYLSRHAMEDMPPEAMEKAISHPGFRVIVGERIVVEGLKE